MRRCRSGLTKKLIAARARFAPPARRAHSALERWTRLIASLVPKGDRPSWVEEWEGELWYSVALRPDPIRWSQALGIGLGVLNDAFHLRMSASRDVMNEVLGRAAQGLLSEVRVAIRAVCKAPGFAAAVVATLGLGVGAAVTSFSVVDSLLVNPLPYPDAERTVIVWQGRPGAKVERDWLSAAQFADVRAGTRTFDLLALTRGSPATLLGTEGPLRVGCVETSSALMSLLGARAALGRVLQAGDDSAAAPTVAVMSHELWQRVFGGDEDIVGRFIGVDGDHVEVVGVLAPGVTLDSEVVPTVGNTGRVDVVLSLPMSAKLLSDRAMENYSVLGRLRGGARVRDAQDELDVVANGIRERHDPEVFLYAVPLLDQVVGDVRRALFVLLGAVGGLLIIACVNVANLLLARASSRKREMGIRAVMGAERVRLVRQLLTESTVLAGMGGAIGVVMAFAGVAAVRRFGAASLPRAAEIGIDGRVLAISCAITALAVLAFGLVPAWLMSTVDLSGIARSGARGTVGTGSGSLWSRSSLANVLVATQIALSLLLLIGGGLLVKSFFAIQRVDPGFRSEGRLTFHVQLSGRSYDEPTSRHAFYRRLMGRLRALPGVEAAGGVSALPFSEGVSWGPIQIDDYDFSVGRDAHIVSDIRTTLPGYFDTMEIPLLSGRLFEDEEQPEAPWSMVIDENFAEKYFPDRDPIGTRVRFWGGREATIVGVVGKVKQYALDDDPRVAAYLPESQVDARRMYVVVRSSGDTNDLASVILSSVRDLDPELALVGFTPMSDRVSRSLETRRFSTAVLQGIGVVALLLAAIGVYGVVSSRVNQGVRELGLRVALGAPAPRIAALVLEHGLILGTIGVGIGLIAAVASTGLLRSMLFAVDSLDAITFAAMSGVLLAASLLACYVPARRAMRVDPLAVLRAE